jgi:hypothetical protein
MRNSSSHSSFTHPLQPFHSRSGHRHIRSKASPAVEFVSGNPWPPGASGSGCGARIHLSYLQHHSKVLPRCKPVIRLTRFLPVRQGPLLEIRPGIAPLKPPAHTPADFLDRACKDKKCAASAVSRTATLVARPPLAASAIVGVRHTIWRDDNLAPSSHRLRRTAKTTSGTRHICQPEFQPWL